ncbi:MAG: nitrilase-related carbon-nitrogen hydrolase, partial [bacterium]
MSAELKFALAQINPTVGDLGGNLAAITEHCRAARDQLGADAIVFPELAICGYPPEDLLLRDDFLARCDECMDELQASARGIAVFIGHPLRRRGRVFNALSVLRDGEARAVYRKRLLPNYTVFDEKRYFAAGREARVIDLRGVRVGLLVCEDLWQPAPAKQTAALGAELIVAINASPFHSAQGELREEGVVAERARECGVPMLYLNQVGGQDELVFDGASVAVDARGEVVARLPAFEPAMASVTFRRGADDGGDGGDNDSRRIFSDRQG